MDSRINRTSLAWGISGLIIQFCSPLFDTFHWPLFIVGEVLFLIGLAYYAKAKGRSPAWGLFGLLWILGIPFLYYLQDKLKSTDAAVTTP